MTIRDRRLLREARDAARHQNLSGPEATYDPRRRATRSAGAADRTDRGEDDA